MARTTQARRVFVGGHRTSEREAHLAIDASPTWNAAHRQKRRHPRGIIVSPTSIERQVIGERIADLEQNQTSRVALAVQRWLA